MEREVIMTTKGLADYLKVTQQHIYNLRKDKGLPYFRVGDTCRYKWGEVQDWLNKTKE